MSGATASRRAPRPDESRLAIRRRAIRDAVLALPLVANAPVDYAVNVIDMMLPPPDSEHEWLQRYPVDAARQAVRELQTLLSAAEQFTAASAALGPAAIDALNHAKDERDLRQPSPQSDWSFVRQNRPEEVWPGLLPIIAAAIEALSALPPGAGRTPRGNLGEVVRLLVSLYPMLTGKSPVKSRDPTPFSRFVIAVLRAAGIEDIDGFRYTGE